MLRWIHPQITKKRRDGSINQTGYSILCRIMVDVSICPRKSQACQMLLSVQSSCFALLSYSTLHSFLFFSISIVMILVRFHFNSYMLILQVHVQIKRHSMEELPETDSGISQWCKDIFVEKVYFRIIVTFPLLCVCNTSIWLYTET